MRDTRTLKKLKQTTILSQTIGRPATGPHESKGGEIRYKILQRVANIVSLLVLDRCFAFFALCDQLVAQQKFVDLLM